MSLKNRQSRGSVDCTRFKVVVRRERQRAIRLPLSRSVADVRRHPTGICPRRPQMVRCDRTN
jgi:hypothetical protein